MIDKMEHLSENDLEKLNSTKGLHAMLQNEEINLKKTIRYVDYTKQLKELQVELIRQQACIIEVKDGMNIKRQTGLPQVGNPDKSE